MENGPKWKSAFWYPVQKYRMKPIKNDIYLFYVPFGMQIIHKIDVIQHIAALILFFNFQLSRLLF